MRIILSFFCAFLSLSSFGSDNHAGKDSMNGISYKEHKDFPEKWPLVTIRFRKDTGEMRLTYGNELAMKTLQSGAINYPDGAVFAKTGVHTGVDEQFTSSVVPKGIRRYQLMVKDKKKYASTGGWGYALFDPDGKTFPEEPVAAQNACYACHALVENRGDVFSQPFSFIEKTKMPQIKQIAQTSAIKFEWKQVKKLPKNVASILPNEHKKLRWLAHKKLRENVFQGTLDELKPILESESRVSSAPVLFMSADEKRFVLVVPGQDDNCVGGGAFRVWSTDMNLKVVEEGYCTHD